MYYRLIQDTFIRSIGEYGYIYSQLTKHDRTYTNSGRIFLNVLSRSPQEFEDLLELVCHQFDDCSKDDVRNDFKTFLDSLVCDRYLVSAESKEECLQKDYSFSYENNPKTSFSYNAQQNENDGKIYKDSQALLNNIYEQNPAIHSCQIEVNNNCNERCIHCYIPHDLKNDRMSYMLLENVMEQLHEMKTLELTLSGGEFFCHPDAEKILVKARELDFSINVLSNLTLLTPRMIDVLKDVRPSMVQTSLYSVYSEEHDHITQLKGSCEKTKEKIDALIAANVPVQISCPVMRTNYKTYKDVLKYAYDRNCKAQTDFVMMARFDFTTDNLVERLSLEESAELINDIIKFDTDYLRLLDTPIEEKTREEWGREIFCGVGLDNMCIAANGTVYPCSGWQGMPCGNVKEQPIKEIWEKSPELNKLRKLTKSAIPQCFNCEDRLYCSPCLVRNYNESGGDYLKVAKHFCEVNHLNRILVEEAKAKRKACPGKC